MKNFLLCCVFAISFLLAESAREIHHFKSYDEHFKHGAKNPHFDHLSILGSKKAEVEFDEMEPEESKKQLAKLIPKMDLNGDTKLQLPELQSWIFNSYKSLDLDEANEEFKTVDLDHDGKGTWDEYLKKVYSYTTQDLDNLKKTNVEELKDVENMIADDKNKFAQADLNHDGALDMQEFPAFVHPHDHKHMHDLEIKHAMKEHDKNSDGKVDIKEYKGEGNEHHDETEQLAEEIKFGDYDTNKDGFLDAKEMIAWILPNTMQNAKEEAEHLITDADKDNDKVLTTEEVLGSFETFVGSQATDYGRQLHLVKEEL